MSEFDFGHALWFVGQLSEFLYSLECIQLPGSLFRPHISSVSRWEMLLISAGAALSCCFLLAARWVRDDWALMSPLRSGSWTSERSMNVNLLRPAIFARVAFEQRPRHLHPRRLHPRHLLRTFVSTCQSLPIPIAQTYTLGCWSPLPEFRSD
jgi:hypothetical protein